MNLRQTSQQIKELRNCVIQISPKPIKKLLDSKYKKGDDISEEDLAMYSNLSSIISHCQWMLGTLSPDYAKTLQVGKSAMTACCNTPKRRRARDRERARYWKEQEQKCAWDKPC